MNTIVVRRAEFEDITNINQIEKRAGNAFSSMPMDFLCSLPQEIPLHSYGFYEKKIRSNELFVAEIENKVVGFICISNINEESAIHVSEFAVDYTYQKRRIGFQLINVVIELAKKKHKSITLTTFSNVPWNAPFYEKLGFVTIDKSQLNERLVLLLAQESEMGLPKEYRCAMRLWVS
ncbi:GNAT family N-acetyltransferase [Photobacterium aquae]|nr:GNAT family N-acetyltransferase [Photobacterium aquae]